MFYFMIGCTAVGGTLGHLCGDTNAGLGFGFGFGMIGLGISVYLKDGRMI